MALKTNELITCNNSHTIILVTGRRRRSNDVITSTILSCSLGNRNISCYENTAKGNKAKLLQEYIQIKLIRTTSTIFIHNKIRSRMLIYNI